MIVRATFASLVFSIQMLLPVAAQTPDPTTGEPAMTTDKVAELLQEVDATTDLDDTKKAAIKQLYQKASTAIESIEPATADAARFEAMIQSAADDLARVDAEAAAISKAAPAIPAGLTMAQLQQKLAEADAELLRTREQVAELSREVSTRQTRPQEVPQELEAARKQLADLNTQLTTPAPENEHPQMSRARRFHLRSQIAALTSKIAALEKELPAYAATADLLPKQRDLAGQQQSLAQATRDALAQRIETLRRTEVSAQVEDAKQAMDATAGTLKPIAAQTYDYARQNQTILRQLQSIDDDRSTVERALDSVRQEFERTQEKVETVGLTDALGILLRSKRGQLAALRSEYQPDLARRSIVRDVQLDLLELEDQRTNLTHLDLAIDDQLAQLELKLDDKSVRAQVEDLLSQQRQVVDSLLQNQRAYFESLVALDSAEHELVQQIDEFASFTKGWVLWVRSSNTLSPADMHHAIDAARSLIEPGRWSDEVAVIGSIARRRLFVNVIFAFTFGLLLWRQRRLRIRLKELGKRAESKRCREFAPTVEAAILTLIIAAVWPTLLCFLGWQIGSGAAGNLRVLGLGWALIVSGGFLFLVEFTRQLLRNNGLAESHFAWPEPSRRAFSSQLRWFAVLTAFVAITVYYQIQPNIEHHNSLGRFSFMVLMLGSIVLVWQTLHPASKTFAQLGERNPASWAYRLRHPIFYCVAGLPCLMLILAVAGYYYSAYQLAQRLLDSVAVAIGLVTVIGLLLRWILIRRRRLAFQQKLAERIQARQRDPNSTESESDLFDQAETAVDFVDVTRQTRELMRVLLAVVAFVSLWWLWQDVLPALELLTSIEVWRLTSPERIEIITLKQLFFCVVTLCLTFVAVKNVPGLLEFLFLQRLPLDAGARYAVTTIARYLLVLLGAVISFSFIHVQWSQYGWLVAAATVGLGFGLQEIFANFVSGLIVLLERPIRVGDIVTVDGTTGVVQRIRMRATVLRNWDHQELIVPNKEFVTTKLLNWTLSNSINRIVITVGVAYATDTDRARSILLEIVHNHENIVADPEPSVTFEQFGDSTLNFVIRCYIPRLDGRLQTTSELHQQIHERFHAAGIEIAFPQRDLHVRSMPTEWTPPTKNS